MLYVLPISLIAIGFGRRAGIIAGGVAVGLLATWTLLSDVSLTPLGWLSRVDGPARSGATGSGPGTSDEPWTEAEVSTRDGLVEGYTIEPGDLPPGGSLHAKAVDGRLLYWHGLPRDGAYSPTVVVVDDRTLEPVGEVVTNFTVDPGDLTSYRATAATETGGLFAIAGESTDASEATADAASVVVLDAATGTELFRVRHSAPVNAVAFDREARFVVAGGDDGLVMVIDLASQDVIERMSMSDSDPVMAVGTSPEGAVIAVARRSIEMFDRRGSPLGLPVPIPSSGTARIRPDGTVVVVPIADPESIQVIDPTGGPLVEQGWRVDPSALVGFGAGRAGVVNTSDDIEMVDLDSGTRTTMEPKLPDGELIDAVAIAPEDGGYLAWDRRGSVARWRDGEVTEWLELWSGSGHVGLSRDSTDPGAAHPKRLSVPALPRSSWADSLRRCTASTRHPGHWKSSRRSAPRREQRSVPLPPRTAGSTCCSTTVSCGPMTDPGNGSPRSPRVSPTRGSSSPTRRLAPSRSAANAAPCSPTRRRRPSSGWRVSAPSSRSHLFAGHAARRCRIERHGPTVGYPASGVHRHPVERRWHGVTVSAVVRRVDGLDLDRHLRHDPPVLARPARWVEQVCDLAGRELTRDEWERLVPGDESHRPACR